MDAVILLAMTVGREDREGARTVYWVRIAGLVRNEEKFNHQ